MALRLLLGVTLKKKSIGFVREWMLIHLSMKFEINIPFIMGYFEHIYKLPIKFFSTRKTGDVIARFLVAFTVVIGAALALVMDVGMAAIAGGILFRMNWKPFVILLGMTAVSVFLRFSFVIPIKSGMRP